MDPITLDRIKTAHPIIREKLFDVYKEQCAALKGKVIVRYPYVIRTFAEQGNFYDQGRKKPGPIVTWSRPGYSYHNYGLAFDIVLLKDTNGDGTFDTASWETNVDFDGDGIADWMECIRIAEDHGFESGHWWPKPKKDSPHFQMPLGWSTAQLLEKYNNNQFIPGTNFLKL